MNATIAVDFGAVLDPLFADLFREGVGYAALSYGRVPHTPTFYEWPAEKTRLIAEAEQRNASGENVFYCPALLQSTDTSPKGGLDTKNCTSVEPFPCLWADIDLVDEAGNAKDVNHTLLRRLARDGAWRVRSGRSGHEHAYFPLAEPVDLATFERLNTDLKNALGADHAQSRVKWLRLPTFRSYKPVLPHPREVMITQAPTKRWAVAELEALIRPQQRRKSSPDGRSRRRAPSAQASTEKGVNSLLARHAKVMPPNLSDAFHGVVCRGVEDGVSPDRLEELLTGHVVAERFEDEGRLREMIEASAEKAEFPDVVDRELRVVRASAVRPRRQKWLWEDRVPMAALSLLGGREGSGKSTVGVDMAARVTRGEMEGEFHGVPRSVIYVAAEDSWEYTIRPRLEAANADLDRVLCVEATQDGETENVHLPTDNEALAALIEAEDVGLVVLDPILSSLDPDVDERQQRKLRSALEPINRMADEVACAVLGIVHFNKRESNDIGVLISGLLVWSQVCRASMAMVKHPDEPDQFVLSNGKNNLAPPNTPSLMGRTVEHFVETEEGRTRTARVEWLGESAMSVSDILDPRGSDKPSNAVDRWLTELLTAHEDGVPATEVYRRGEQHAPPFSERSLQRAAGRIGASRDRDGFQGKVVWSLVVEELT